MKQGLPAKFLLIPGLMAFLFLILTFLPKLLPQEGEYKKDQAYLNSVMEKLLPKEPLAEIKYPIQGYRIPGIGGFCWLESSSGLMKYLEPDIDFDTFVFYGRPTLMMAKRNIKERWGPGLNQIHAFVQLGYTPFRGSTSPIDLPQSVFPDIPQQNLIYFKTKDEELLFMKKLISAKIIPTISYGKDFSTIVGYNQKGVWIVRSDARQTDKEGRNFMTPAVPFEPFFTTYEEFFKNWRGDYQFFWFIKTGQRKSENEVYRENKKNAQEAPENLKLVIDYLKKGGDLLDFTFELDIPSAIVLHRYFAKKGNPELARVYLEIAKVYDEQRVSLGIEGKLTREFVIKTLEKTLPFYQKASTLWP